MLPIGRAECEALLRRRLNSRQLKDFEKTGCFDVKLRRMYDDRHERTTPTTIRLSTHNKMPAAIDSDGVCYNAWPSGTAKLGMARALGNYLLLKSDPLTFFRRACFTPSDFEHMQKRRR